MRCALVLAFFLTGASGCGNDQGSCGKCQGCCKGGVCYPANSQTCSQGSCGPTTCPTGCCLNGQCITAQGPSACGIGGLVCQNCGGGSCFNGQCGTGSCNASSCPQGCCTTSGVCLNFAQQSPGACGTGAVVCNSCGSAACVNGQCQSSCNASTCPQGCCYQGVSCLSFAQQSTSACGTGGGVCQGCAFGACQNGQCQGGTCSYTNCQQGCCTTAGQCLGFGQQSDLLCGTSGVACKNCGSGSHCQNGVCNLSCDISSCSLGCCSGSSCIGFSAQTTAQCGTSAAACLPCGYGNGCLTGKCVPASKVTVVSAVVTAKSDPWDGSTATSGPEPDPFVVVKVTATGRSGQTKYINDTFTPYFNQEVLTEAEQALVSGLSAEVREDDGIWPSEYMGTCSVSWISTSTLQGGQLDLTSCSGYVTQVVLSFSK